MKLLDEFKIVVATIGVGCLLVAKACAFELPTNSEDLNKLLSSTMWTNTVLFSNARADLGAQLNWNINEGVVSDFDKQVCKSLGIHSRSPMMISCKELSCVFFSSETNQWFGSQQEMGGSLDLIYHDGQIIRTNTDEQVPDDTILLFDPNVKELTVEINLLLSVAPVGRPQDVKYVRRSFRFVHRNRWVND